MDLCRYMYKVCPFKHATQVEGHSSTRLGLVPVSGALWSQLSSHTGRRCFLGCSASFCTWTGSWASLCMPVLCIAIHPYVRLLWTSDHGKAFKKGTVLWLSRTVIGAGTVQIEAWGWDMISAALIFWFTCVCEFVSSRSETVLQFFRPAFKYLWLRTELPYTTHFMRPRTVDGYRSNFGAAWKLSCSMWRSQAVASWWPQPSNLQFQLSFRFSYILRSISLSCLCRRYVADFSTPAACRDDKLQVRSQSSRTVSEALAARRTEAYLNISLTNGFSIMVQALQQQLEVATGAPEVHEELWALAPLSLFLAPASRRVTLVRILAILRFTFLMETSLHNYHWREHFAEGLKRKERL